MKFEKKKELLKKIIKDAKLFGLSDETVEALEYACEVHPIYRIMMQEYSGAELKNGWPNTGCQADMGFYYDKQDAIDAMHENACDIRECVYDYGFVIEQMPGLYDAPGYWRRIYFKWDNERGGFFEAEEPEQTRYLSF